MALDFVDRSMRLRQKDDQVGSERFERINRGDLDLSCHELTSIWDEGCRQVASGC